MQKREKMASNKLKDNHKETDISRNILQSNITVPNMQSMTIEPLIRLIRGQQVILDFDLASLYGIETKRLKEQVNRNESRFPVDFMFKLTQEEFNSLRSQNATSNKRGGTRYLPYAFTESGIAMLSSVLRTEVAIEVNIRIMRAFTSMRHFLTNNAQIFQRLANVEFHQTETDKRIDEVFKRLDANIQPRQGIFFDGQVFDAYRFISDLIRKAQHSIILIDNYVDDTVLSLIDKRKNSVSAIIYTQHVSKQLQLDIERHNTQYPEIEIKHFQKAHDRFLLIDSEVYHIGASIKDLGKKWFAFTLMHDITSESLINIIPKIT